MSNPFSDAALSYWEAGWNPIPARHTGRVGDKDRSKAPILKGSIGWSASSLRATRPEICGMADEFASRDDVQIGLRMPVGVVGIDMDLYEGKDGYNTSRKLVLRCGPLPATWVSTSKPETGSGIYFYQVKDSTQLCHNAGPGIEMIRACGRFAMVMPSWHPKTGDGYGWERPDGKFVLDEIPSVLELPWLPGPWCKELSASNVQREGKLITNFELEKWIDSRFGGPGGRACADMRRVALVSISEIRTSDVGSRHDTMLIATHKVIGNAAEGHFGLRRVLTALEKEFVAARLGSSVARGEFYRAVKAEVERSIAEGVSSEECMCAALEGGFNV